MPPNEKKIIVTGAAGLIGSAFIWHLNELGIEKIIAVDHLGTSEKWRNLCGLCFLDYLEKDSFRRLLNENTLGKNFDAIFHFGACSSTMEQNASYLIENNFEYSKELAKFAISNNIRFVYASSAATYGDGSKGWLDDESQLDSLIPLNMYGYSKHLFDLWAKRNNILDKITGLKFTNVFGPNEWHKGEMRSVVCKAFEQIKATGKIKLFKSYKKEYADGEQKRDFIYVKDAVKMTAFFLDHNAYGIFNISSGKAETWNSLAEAIFDAMKIPKCIEYIEMPEQIKEKYQYYTCASTEKLRNVGCAVEARPLQDAVKDYVINYLQTGKRLGEK